MNILKRILLYSSCLLVSIVGTVSVLFFVTEMSFGFPGVQELKIKNGKCLVSINENETLNVLVFSRSDITPVVNHRDKIVSFEGQECLEVKDQSFQIQTQDSGGDYLSGVALFSFVWKCVNVGDVELSVDENFFLQNGYFIGTQGEYGKFFFNVFIAITLSILISIILYKVIALIFVKAN